MKVLVTGGAGYIGSHQVKNLLENNIQVVVVDNLLTGHIEAVDKRAKFYLGDIGDIDFMDKIFKEEMIDAVIHFAGSSQVGESMHNPFKYYENNVIKSLKLLEVMVRNGIKKIVFSSSAATYGEKEVMPINESDETCPTNVYGETKLTIEKMIKWYHEVYNLEYVILRYFNVAGSSKDATIGESHNPETHIIPLLIDATVYRRPYFAIFGTDYPTKDGTCIRDYVHVLDLCDAHYLSLCYLNNNLPSEIFNLGSGSGFSVLEMVNCAKKVINNDFIVKEEKRRIGDPAILIASSDKARTVLNWVPKHENIEEMIIDAYHFLKDKPY